MNTMNYIILILTFNLTLTYSKHIYRDVVPHFLGIEIHRDGLGIYGKPTNIGLYTCYTSFSPWATVICDERKFKLNSIESKNW